MSEYQSSSYRSTALPTVSSHVILELSNYKMFQYPYTIYWLLLTENNINKKRCAASHAKI